MNKPRHVVSDEVLAAHAAGQLDFAGRVLVETHLAFSPERLKAHVEMVEPGGRWLDELEPEAPPNAILASLRRRIHETPPKDPLPPGVPLPAAGRAELDGLPPARWQRVPLTRARYLHLHTDADHEADLVLLTLPGSCRFPRHRHHGSEDLVVLTSSYTDELGTWSQGDWVHYPPGSEHGPKAASGGPGWILSRIEKGIDFTGPRGVLQRLLARRSRRARR